MSYLLSRMVQMLLILAILSVALFGLLSAMPGNPVDLLITSNPQVRPEDVIRLKKLRGLDKPWYVQYFRWLYGYQEPARAPVLLNIPIVSSGHKPQEINLKEYIIDPNFSPSTKELSKWLFELWPDWPKAKSA